MISQSEIERVEAEIRKLDHAWLSRMAENILLLQSWLIAVATMYRLSIDIITQAKHFLDYIRRLLRS